MKLVLTFAATLTASIALAGPAAADPPVHPDGVGGHTHHIWLGNGECHDIDSVSWEFESRGLHRGANSSGSLSGAWHGPCPS